MTKRPVILLGSQRSGTTALASILDRAFAEAGGQFTINGKLPYLLHRWCTPADLRGRHLRADEILHALRRRPPYGLSAERWLETTEQVLRAAAAEVADGKITDVVALRRDVIRRSYGAAAFFGEKYNEYMLELDLVAESVPDAMWILLIRHPAQVARSVQRWAGDRPWRTSDHASALAKWVAWHEPWLENERAGRSEHSLVIEYGRLCAGPDLHRLSETLDLDLGRHAYDLRSHNDGGDVAALPQDVATTWYSLLDRTTPSKKKGSGSMTQRQVLPYDTTETASPFGLGLHHVQLAIPPGSEDECREFYIDVLGMTEIQKPPVLAARGGLWVRADGLEIHLGVEEDFRPARKAHPGIQVADLDGLAERLTDKGVTITWDANFPGHRRFYAFDVFGNRLEFLGPDIA
ncbi:hypothetical protein FE391_09155 [Nonomuraea sp. KC401]|uniref:sulfotransferase n=1 Tax=unclassified Nonomuraea TaxID=2593643 RepID=UPI0010FD9CC7|nr:MULTISPECIES: sulfotransferase [unclassified Nonomuraea]NBE92563.1 hypothetical protein [Nonomuraea sp. K271]TLF79760.1 hypothetical protein FE391_09155 [Nonomuraea sp. KC401]